MDEYSKFKIMTWNIKGSASLGWNNQYEIKSELIDKIIAQNAHIIVLTEFVVSKGLDYMFNRFQKEGYIWFMTNQSGKNGILIGIKKDMVDTDNLLEEIYENNMTSSNFDGLNILKIIIPLKSGISLSILGCRMETGKHKPLKQQYDYQKKCFKNILIPKIQPLKEGQIHIVCGDFNNARCLGNLNERFNSKDYEGKAQKNYNINIIKDIFEDLGYIMANIDKDGTPIMTHKGYLPIDHIFVAGLNVKECDKVPVNYLSDHDILLAEVEVK